MLLCFWQEFEWNDIETSICINWLCQRKWWFTASDTNRSETPASSY